MFAGIEDMRPRSPNVDIARYANVLAAMGMASRLRIMRLLLAAHPDGLVVGNIQKQLGFTASNLSCHLKKLKNQKLVIVRPGWHPPLVLGECGGPGGVAPVSLLQVLHAEPGLQPGSSCSDQGLMEEVCLRLWKLQREA